MRIIWSPLAIERVGEIAEYIARDNPSAARQWVEAAFAKAENLADFPNSGRVLPETRRPDLKEIVFGSYRIIYRLREEEIVILTVRHFKQVLPTKEIES